MRNWLALKQFRQMKRSKETMLLDGTQSAPIRCNHPIAVIVDPTDKQLQDLEAMLSQCPNCSHWAPGDGPIMAVISTQTTQLIRESIKLM